MPFSVCFCLHPLQHSTSQTHPLSESWFSACAFCEVDLGSAGHRGGDGNRTVLLSWEGGAVFLYTGLFPLNSWLWIRAGSPTSPLSCGSCLFSPHPSATGLCAGPTGGGPSFQLWSRVGNCGCGLLCNPELNIIYSRIKHSHCKTNLIAVLVVFAEPEFCEFIVWSCGATLTKAGPFHRDRTRAYVIKW